MLGRTWGSNQIGTHYKAWLLGNSQGNSHSKVGLGRAWVTKHKRDTSTSTKMKNKLGTWHLNCQATLVICSRTYVIPNSQKRHPTKNWKMASSLHNRKRVTWLQPTMIMASMMGFIYISINTKWGGLHK